MNQWRDTKWLGDFLIIPLLFYQRVLEMDEKEQMDPAVIAGLFEMGLMGIEVPTEHGGAGGRWFVVRSLGKTSRVTKKQRCEQPI